MSKRDWSWAFAKVADEGKCRVCGSRVDLDPAHVIPRSLGGDNGSVVSPSEIVPLCRTHHTDYDQHRLDLLPYLSKQEQAVAVSHVGIVAALTLTTGERPHRAPPKDTGDKSRWGQ